MRGNATITAWALALLVPLLVLGAGAGEAPEPDDGVDVWFRDADLGALSSQHQEVYLDAEPGESSKLERAFPDAPPQISHTVEDMLPITGGDNECMECHHPDNVTKKEEAPIPETHFEDAIMADGKPGEGLVWKVKGYKKGEDVSGSRFNCTMCHAPQATNVKTPTNLFVVEKAQEK